MGPKKETKHKRIVLLDAHAILHRAYHALPEFTSTAGEPTGGLFGLSSMLLKMVNELKPDYLIACYDLPHPTFRHDAYDGYKAGRAKIDDALVHQIERSRDVFAAFSIPIYEKAGFEADDILATIVEQVKKKKDLDVVIASGDMDTLQLVSGKRVMVYTLKKGIADTILYDEDAVKKRFGFEPKLLPDFKGLRGDPSDNIIGIKGIGEKTATDLITSFGSIENIYKALKKDRNALLAAGVKARMVELLEAGKEEALFSKMLATVKRDVPIAFILPPKIWSETRDLSEVLTLFRNLNFKALSERAKLLLASSHEKGILEEAALSKEIEKREIVPDQALEKAALALWLLDSTMTSPTLEDILQYGKAETFVDAQENIMKEVREKGLHDVYEKIELPLIPVVKKMQKRGICIDVPYLKQLSKKYHTELTAIEGHIWKEAGRQFNVNSPPQLGAVLFDELGLSVKGLKKTAGGAKSTRESELEKLRDAHPIVAHILEYRVFQKLLSTYIDNIPDMVDEDGRLHATFSQTGTTTGRMSSNNPNLQNIPIKTELGNNIRKAFVASRDFRLVSFDYSQIELRIAAFLSGDSKLIEIFKDGGDVHAAVAAQVFGVERAHVDKEMRRRAKVINFGILYGMGVSALQSNLGTPRSEAQKFYNEYFHTFSGLSDYLETIKKQARKNGYTTTFFGRRRNFEGINSPIPYIKAMAERMAVNAPIQGTQSDIIKIAMARIDEYIIKERKENDVFLLLQVHDELVYEIRDIAMDAIVPRIKEIMESVISLQERRGVPMVTSVAKGDTWGEMHAY